MNTHILTKNGLSLRAALHINIPATNNAVGVSWQTAVVNCGLFGPTPASGFWAGPPVSALPTGNGPGQITAAELALIASGAVIEVIEEYRPNAAEIAGGAAYLDAMYAARSAVWLAHYQDVLRFFGFTR